MNDINRNLNLLLNKQNNILKTIDINNKIYLETPDEIRLQSVKIIDYKIINYINHSYVLYKLEIKNYNYKTVYCWKRYNDFELLYTKLIKDKSHNKNILPKIPKKIIFGNLLYNNILQRINELNNFLLILSNNEEIQWGINVNDDINIYKRRNKNIKVINFNKN